MKMRLGHVTNSSSSSFIIGKPDDKSYTVDAVYQLLRDLYKELLNGKRNLVTYLDNHPDYPVSHDHIGFHINIKKDPKKYREVMEETERMFGKGIMDNISFDEGWLSCDSYKEYEEYWLQNFKENKDKRAYAPFTIADLENDHEIFWPHASSHKHICMERHDISSQSELFQWYEDEQDLNLDEDDYTICKMLGRICIYSECGYIPQMIVDKLYNISEYACNHMG